jgi:hypothetical protein
MVGLIVTIDCLTEDWLKFDKRTIYY